MPRHYGKFQERLIGHEIREDFCAEADAPRSEFNGWDFVLSTPHTGLALDWLIELFT